MGKEVKQTNREYLSYLADRIASERPSSTIILNTLVGIEEHGYNRGYRARLSDGQKFRDLKDKRRKASWDGVKNYIEDCCSKATEVINEQPE